MNAYTTVDLDEIEPAGPGGAVRFVRRALGGAAFGINQFILPPEFAGPEHNEADSRQEEVYVVIAGGGTLRVGDDLVEMRPGRFVRVDAGATRQMTAGATGLTFIAIGAPPGAYAPRGPF